MNEDRFWRSDLGQSFAKLIDTMFVEVNSERVEKLSDGKYKRVKDGFVGKFPEVAARIRSDNVAARNALKESLDRTKDLTHNQNANNPQHT